MTRPSNGTTNIVTGKDTPILRATAQPVQHFDDDLHELTTAMHGAMIQANGVGLAAPQIGKSLRLFVVHPDFMPPNVLQDAQQDNNSPVVFANPVIINKKTRVAQQEEGCLSLPDVTVHVPRTEDITIQAQTVTGAHFTATVSGFPARILQHECDHLEGVLIIDRGTIVANNGNA